jgi:hypothetical protein
MLMAAIQLTIVSPLRVGGVVIMVTWLWPIVVGLRGGVLPALVAAGVTGAFFDAQVATPLGLLTAVTLLIGWIAGVLGREGVGDFGASAWWVAPALASGFGFVAPIVVAFVGIVIANFGLWHASLGNTMVVNAMAFFILVRPLGRVCQWLVGDLGDLR